MVAVIAYGQQLSQEYKMLNNSLKVYIEESSNKNAALDELNASIGYGGLIHNFKNFVLRQNEEYHHRVLASFDQTNYWLNRLGQIIKTDEEIKHLQDISKTVQEYKSKFFLAVRHVENGISPFELDKIVKINDAAAMVAISALSEISKRRSEEFLVKTTIANEKYAEKLKYIWAIAVMIVVTGFAIIIIVRKLSVSSVKTDEALKHITSLYDATPDALLAVNKSGVIEKANRQSEAIFGYSADVLVGMKVEKLIPEKYRNSHIAMRTGYFESPGFRPMGGGLDLRALRSDGREIEVEISLSHSRINDQEQAIVAIRDITTSRKTERELAISLQRENRAAQFKAKLLSNMSHELRTPLSQISGFSQLMVGEKEEVVPSKIKKWAGEIEKSSQSLLKLVDSILSFAQKDTIKVKIKVTKVGETLNSIVSQLKFDQEYEKADIILEDTNALNEIVYCARNVLESTLHEALTNAVKFSDQQVPVIKIRVEFEDNFLWIRVMDNGPGIAEKAFENVFRPFERLNAFERAIDGVGMGLTLTRQIVNSAEGIIQFEKYEGGACLLIKLPAYHDPH